MSEDLRPSPRRQRELQSKNRTSNYSRANDTRRDEDTIKSPEIGLYDIDNAIKYYFDNVIQPSVKEDGRIIPVPTTYGSPEKWKNVEEEGYIRDRNKRILTPLIVYKRASITKRRDLANKVDSNFPRIYGSIPVRYSPQNRYDSFSVSQSSNPITSYINIVIPDFVEITYDVIVWTNYVEQMNKILESLIYSEGTYWGDQERFQFQAYIDDYTNTTDLLDTEDRIVRSTFTINLQGRLITDVLAKAVSERLGENTQSTRHLNIDTSADGN